MSDVQVPDLTGATVYREVAESRITNAWWYVVPDGSVWFQQPHDLARKRLQKGLITPSMLRDSPRFEATDAPTIEVAKQPDAAEPTSAG